MGEENKTKNVKSHWGRKERGPPVYRMLSVLSDKLCRDNKAIPSRVQQKCLKNDFSCSTSSILHKSTF